MKRSLVWLASPLLWFGCFEADPVDPFVEPDLEDCPPMYRQDVLPEYQLDIAPAEWAALQDELLHRPEREAQGLDPTPYHPADFRYLAGDEDLAVPDVRVRLKGQSSWLQTIELDANPKMQLVIAFNEVDKAGRFLGVRKLDLDMPRTDQTYLRQRLALRYLRAAGEPAQCANSARLVINGEYYGLYTNLERFDKELLQRNFGDDDEGDLWAGGRVIKTNEDTFTWDRLDALWGVTQVDELDGLADLDASLHEWAAEAVAGDADGYYNGRANFYIYDHPTRGFVWMPTDLDTAFDNDFLRLDASPIFPACSGRSEGDWQHDRLVMNDPVAVERYVVALRDQLDQLDVVALQEDLDAWAAQIDDAAIADPHRSFTMADHDDAIEQTYAYLDTRAEFLEGWLACWADGGDDDDADGFDFCHDCDDADASISPAALETCNDRDDDCNGAVDDGACL